jgi:VWFA-related protein
MIKRYLLTISLISQMICSVVAQQPGTPPIGPPPPERTTQQQPQKTGDDEVVKITTNLVQVDAVVTDKNGNVVTDLRPDEVQIFEDGKPQKITHFTYNVTATQLANRTVKPPAPSKSNEVAPPVVPETSKPENVHRTIAIVVDDLGLSFESISILRRALMKFVDEQIQPGDLVAIIRTAGGAGVLQQFTSDKRQLHAAIERVKFNLMGRADVSAFSAIRPPDLKIPDEKESRNQTAENFREEVFSVGTLGTLRYVVHGLGEMPGRKSVLLLSDGLKIFNPGDPNGTSRVQTALESLTDLANRASVVIYTMDARGLPTFGLQAQDNVQMSAPVGRPGRGGPIGVTRSVREVDQLMTIRRDSFYESQNGLNYLAQQTGGLAIRNTNNLSGGIQRVLDDQRGYYLIGYRPEESTFDEKSGRRKFHHLTLKVTRSGKYDIRMRNGFFGISDEEARPAQKTAAQRMVATISSPFGSSDVHLQLTSLFANDATNGSFMRSLLHIDARDLTFKDGPNGTHECVFDVLAMTFGDNGATVDYNGQTYTVQLPEAEYRRAMQQGMVYNVTVPIKKHGAYQFRMALRDTATDRVGSVNQFIDVPDLDSKRLALSGVVLSGKTIAQDGKVSLQTDPEASPALRHFKQMMRLEYGLLVYNAGMDKASGKPQLTTQIRLFRDGKQVFAGNELPFDPTGQSDMGRLVVGGALDLGTDLSPGDYIFQVIISDSLADKKYRVATQWMDFEISK